MPTILETDIGEIEMPDDWSADQIKDWAHTRLPTIREGLKKGSLAEKPARIGRDVAEAGADVIKGLARGRQVLRDASIATNLRQLGLQAAMSAPVEEQPEILKASETAATQAEKKLSKTREQRLQENPVYQFGEQTTEAARDFYAVNPEQEGTIPSKLIRAAASTIPVLAAAPGGPVAMGATYAAMSGQQGAEEAIAEGRPDKADEAYLAYAGLGALSEAALGYPMALLRTIRAARRAGIPPKAFGEAAKKSFPQLAGRVAKESGKAAVREAVQESTEQLGQNIAARDVIGFDPDRERTQGVKEAAIYGGAVGGLFGGAFGTAQAYDARRQSIEQPKAQEKSDLFSTIFEKFDNVEVLDGRNGKSTIYGWNNDGNSSSEITVDTENVPESIRLRKAKNVVPPMFDQPATGWAVGEDGTRLSELTLTQPEAPTPAPEAEPPRRRSPIAPAAEPPRFRPPIPNVPTPPEETPVRPAPAAPPVAPPMAPSPAGAPAVSPTPPTTPVTQEVPSAIQPQGETFQDWRIQGNIIRHSNIGKRLNENDATSIIAAMKGYGVGGRFDSARGVVVVNSGLMSDVSRMWEDLGSYAKAANKRKAAKEARGAEVAGIESARKSELQQMPSAKWIDEVFGVDAMNSHNKLELAKYLESKTDKFNGLPNPKWKSGLDKLKAATIPDVKAAYEASQSQPQEKQDATIRQRISEKVPLEAQTQTGPQVVPQVRSPERPPETQAPQAPGEIALQPQPNAGEEVKTEQAPSTPAPKFSVTLEQPTEPTVGLQDVLNAFPSEQGFAVRPTEITWSDGEQSRGFLIRLPNGQAILIDPSRDRINFDPEKAAADWGLDPRTVAESGIARGSFLAGGVQIKGLSSIGLIELINTAGPSTLSHEKFHALFEMALTQEDRKSILDRYKTEEKAAEAFRRSEGFTRGFWDKMRQFIERLANLFRGDAFAKLRAPLSPDFVPQPIAQGRKYSLEDVFRSRESLDQFISKPTVSPEEAANLRQQAGARAALVPDQIADEIRGLNAADPIEKRMASLLEFVLRMHGLAPALEIQRILADTNIAPELKDAAISAVLRAIEHVRVQTTEVDDQLQQAMANLAAKVKAMGKVTKEQLIEAKSKQIADNLLTGYRAYLTAQAASLPADQNIAAARQQLINRMDARLAQEQRLPDATIRALQAIALRIGELPVAQGPAAVIEAIRAKGILKGVVGESVADLLTDEKPGGLPPLLLNPQINELLVQLADLQKKAENYAKQIEMVEQAFRGKGEPTPVELKRFAETYRKFRNKQAEAAKAITESSKDLREAAEDVEVYSRSKDILDRLQSDPSFRAQFEAAISSPNGIVFSDIWKADKDTGEILYISPLKQVDDQGKETQNEYRVLLAPDRQADQQTLSNMLSLVKEINEWLASGPADPIEVQTWTKRRDYLLRFTLTPQFGQKQKGWEWETPYGIITLNPFSWVQLVAGGRARGPRSELERMSVRAAREANQAFTVTDQAHVGYRLVTNNREYGDEVSKVAAISALKSHGWTVERLAYWNDHILNPIIASGQAPGQMRLGVGDYIPGTGVKITKEDMAVARMQKRYSQAIVQTTQGTGKGIPGIIRFNPVLVEDTFAGRPTVRAALGPGPLTMSRRFSNWGQGFMRQWRAAPSAEARRRLLADGSNFQAAVLGYVTTTNPEFENQSPLKPVYEAYAALAKTEEEYQVQSLDQLIDRLADIAVKRKLFENKDEAQQQIETTLLSEINQHVETYFREVEELTPARPSFAGPEAAMQYASVNNPFTKARKRMVAPDPYYDYTLTTEVDRIGFVASGYQMFQLNQITALERLSRALELKQQEWDAEIDRLHKDQGMTRRQARREVQRRTAKQLGDLRFSYVRLVANKRVIDKILKDLSELVIDIRDPNDSAALFALSRFRSTLSSALLSNPLAIANNTIGGVFGAQWVTMRNLGRASFLLGTPIKSAVNTTGVLTKKLLSIYPVQSAIGRVARSNLPLVRDMARLIDDQVREWTTLHAEAQAWGLRSPVDMRNRIRAMGELKASAGKLEREPTPMMEAVPNWLESLPGIRQFLGHLRDKSPRIFDEVVNLTNAIGQQKDIFDWLRTRAVQAFEARSQLAARTGRADINDFTSEANLLSPDELGMRESSGFRDLDNLRQVFDVVGGFDAFLLDYYQRYNAAPEGQKADVPLFPDPADEGAVLFNLAAHGNIPTAGFTPPSMAGVGQRGLIKSLIFMFRNYALRLAAQIERIADKDLRDPKGWREAYAFWSMFATLIMLVIAGLFSTEIGVPATRVITGRAPSRVTLANVLADPDAAMVARYTGMALGNNLPYYGQVISEMLGNPGYGSWWDATSLIPIAGLVKDTSVALTRVKQTHDPFYPALDFIGRWFPPVSPIIRLLPGIAGDIEAKNVSRALRVVGPSEGMELAGGGGGSYAQTPATPEIRRLIAAAYQGDEAGVKRAFDAAVAAKEAMGSADPVRAVKQSLAAAVPARRVFGRSITEAEEQQLIGQMSSGQRETYAGAQSAFDLINRTLGTNYRLTSAPRSTRTRTSRRRRLTGGRRLPSIRRSSRSRRSPFSRYRVRRVSGRRRRRSPSFSTSA